MSQINVLMQSLCQVPLPTVAVEIERLSSRSYLNRQHYRIVFKEVGEGEQREELQIHVPRHTGHV